TGLSDPGRITLSHELVFAGDKHTTLTIGLWRTPHQFGSPLYNGRLNWLGSMPNLVPLPDLNKFPLLVNPDQNLRGELAFFASRKYIVELVRHTIVEKFSATNYRVGYAYDADAGGQFVVFREPSVKLINAGRGAGAASEIQVVVHGK